MGMFPDCCDRGPKESASFSGSLRAMSGPPAVSFIFVCFVLFVFVASGSYVFARSILFVSTFAYNFCSEGIYTRFYLYCNVWSDSNFFGGTFDLCVMYNW